MDSSPGAKITSFVRRPSTVLRFISIIFAIVVFGCISSGGYAEYDGPCLFHEKAGACDYGIAIGVIAFLGCILFLVIDMQFDTINSPETKKYIVLADLGFSALWCFLWFVGFCYLTDMWRRQDKSSLHRFKVNSCQAAITFSFFSIITWGGLTVIAFKRYRQMLTEFEYTNDNLAGDTYSSPYASFPTPQNHGDPYQSKPFSDPPSNSSSVDDGAPKFTPPPY